MNENKMKKLEESKSEKWGCRGINPKFCKTCWFSHGDPPFADLPEKCHCMIFEYPTDKPDEVYFDGAECEYYEAE